MYWYRRQKIDVSLYTGAVRTKWRLKQNTHGNKWKSFNAYQESQGNYEIVKE